jgi:hypothetical protein
VRFDVSKEDDENTDDRIISLPSPTNKRRRKNDDTKARNTTRIPVPPTRNTTFRNDDDDDDNNISSECLLCRHTAQVTLSSSSSSMEIDPQRQLPSTTMILHGHLGDPCNMVQHLVDDFQDWSLTRRWSGAEKTIPNPHSSLKTEENSAAAASAAAATCSSRSMQQQRRQRQQLSKIAERQVRRALLSNLAVVSDIKSSKDSTTKSNTSITKHCESKVCWCVHSAF